MNARVIGRSLACTLVLAMVHLAAEPANYLYALETARAKEAQIREIARKMNVDPEFLLHPGGRPGGRRTFDFAALLTSIFASSQSKVSPQSEDVKAEIARVKSRYALVAADTTLAKIAELMEIALAPENTRGKKKGRIKAELQSVSRLIDKDFLPPLEEGLPGLATSRDAQMRVALGRMRQDVKAILNAPHALDEKNLEGTLASVRQVLSGSLRLRGNGQPRWVRDPFPVKDSFKQAPISTTDRRYGDASSGKSSTTPAVVSSAVRPPVASARLTTNAIASDIAALATQLGTPAKAFAYVYDRVDWESYGGVAKGARGTLHERRGNDWDQALLLRDLLIAQGYSAQLEWGKVDLPIARAMNLAGTEDPTMAGNLLATAGFDAVTLVQNGAPVAIRMTHAWVRAFIPYLPNRGATAGPADTWVRMDPSFKRYEYQSGIDVNVPWNENEYLQTSAVRPPNDFHADGIWAYIRANNLNCNNLAQVPKTGRIRAANYPFIPATLNTRVDSFLGLAAQPPASMMQTISLTVVDPYRGDVLVSWSGSFADLWGRKLSITFPTATSDDAAIIERYGGLYNTPAYLVRLKAVISIDDQPVAEGGSVAPGADLSLDLSFGQPYLGSDHARHDIAAGETMVEVFDSGRAPDSLIQERITRMQAIVVQPASDAQREALLTEKLSITGLRYFQEVDDGIDFAAGMQWHRWVKSTFEGLVSQRLTVTYNFIGQAIRVSPADRNLDVTRVALGIIPIRSDLSERDDAIALSGLHSSYLEGAIWEEVEAQQGISATKALLLSRMAGQTIRTADRTNVESVLAATNLPAETESNIRGAVAQGRIAVIPSANIRVNRWVGTGYILRDPVTGAATYPISGGFAGGSSTGAGTSGTRDTLGSEPWLGGFLAMLDEILDSLGLSPRPDSGPVGTPTTAQSDPVNVATGNMYRAFTDLVIVARGQPVGVERTYNSRSTYSGPFGYGWTAWFDEQLLAASATTRLWRQSDGTEHLFTRNADGTWTAPAGIHNDLTVDANSASMRAVDGRVRVFDVNGRLTSIADPNDNAITIVRDGTGAPQSIVDASGRTVLTFTLTNGRITGIADHTGRMLAYAYDGEDLVSSTDTAGKTWTYAYDLRHNLTQVTDPLGNANAYDYDSDDRIMRHTDPLGAEELFHYDIAGRHTAVTDRRGGDRLIRYDDEGRATMEVDPAGNMATAAWDADSNRTSVVDSRGYTRTMEYDSNGNLTRNSLPDGSVETTTWSELSRPLVITDASGMVTRNTYDADGNLLESVRTIRGVIETTTNTFDGHGQLLTTTDPNGNVSTTVWNDYGSVVARRNALNETTTITVDELGRTTELRDPAGNVSTMRYDAKDRVTYVKDSYGREMNLAYDAAGRRTSIADGLGTMTFTYDGKSRLLTTTDALGNTARNTYNPAGDLVAEQDRRGSVTRYEYDEVGRMRRKIDANGGIWSYDWCASIGSAGPANDGCASCSSRSGNSFCELVDPNGNRVKQEFDVMGRVSRVVDTMAHVSVIAYDRNGRRTALTDANGHTTRYAYDEAGRLLEVTQANGAKTKYTYDRNGNKLTQEDANGHVWSFAYDALDRLISETDPLQRTTTYRYDNLGNLITRTDPANQATRFTYTIARMTGISFPDGTSEAYAYDLYGRRTSMSNAGVTYTMTYDANHRMKSVTNSKVAATIAYEYDGNGRRTKMTTVQGAVAYAYDALGRLTSMNDPVFGRFRFGYDSAGRRTELHYPNGVTTSYAYDEANRMTALATRAADGALVDAWSYTYDATGKRISKTDLDARTETYAFDDVDRIVSATYADGTGERFTYDPAGNRKSLTDLAGSVTNYAYDAANQLVSAGSDAFTYDARGNMLTRQGPSGTTTLTYDHRNRVTRIAAGAAIETSEYAPNGLRVAVTGPVVENNNIRVQYDLDANPILDHDTGNNVSIYRAYGPGMDEPLAEWRRGNNQITFLHRDGIGSITAVSNSSGQRLYRQTYTVFGSMARSAVPGGIVPTRLGFTGRELSVGSLMQYRARYYDTSIGRFTAQDDYRGSDIVPPSLHRYAYVNNDPVNYVDPTGRVWKTVLLAIGVGILLAGAALASLNAFNYFNGESCAQFAACLFLVSGVIIPRILLHLAYKTMTTSWSVYAFLAGAWLIAQNNCMALGWWLQRSPEWQYSQTVCNDQGWQSTSCCKERINAEQAGYSHCLNYTLPGHLAPIAEALFPFWLRQFIGHHILCRC